MTLQNVSWRPAYESEFGRDETLMDAFCRPFLSEVVRYSWLAGYYLSAVTPTLSEIRTRC